MKVISFSWTLAPLLAGAKTVTRRSWQDKYAKQFKKGDRVLAYDRQIRFGGKAYAIIELTETPTFQNTKEMTDDEYITEGFEWLDQNPESKPKKWKDKSMKKYFNEWRNSGEDMYVVRFKLVEKLQSLNK